MQANKLGIEYGCPMKIIPDDNNISDNKLSPEVLKRNRSDGFGQLHSDNSVRENAKSISMSIVAEKSLMNGY